MITQGLNSRGGQTTQGLNASPGTAPPLVSEDDRLIYGLTRALQSRLRGRKYPFEIRYGPERNRRRARFETGVVMQRDRQRSESFGESNLNRMGSRISRSRSITAEALIYAASTSPGASVQHHEDLADCLVDALVSELHRWTKEKGVELILLTGKLLTSEEIRGTHDVWAGAVYRLQFDLIRGIERLDFDGASEFGESQIDQVVTTGNNIETIEVPPS